MTMLPSLDVLIGLFLIYTVLSLVCSGLNEVVASLLALRASTLKRGLMNVLNDPNARLIASLYAHPLIKGLRRTKLVVLNRAHADGPARISSPVFVDALLDLISPANQSRTVADVIEAIKTCPLLEPDTRKQLIALTEGIGNDYAQLRARWMAWYDDSTAALTRWYSRQMQFVAIILALLVTLVLNVDTIFLVNNLSGDLKLRSALVSAASIYVESHAVNGATVVSKSPAASVPAAETPNANRVRAAVQTTRDAIAEIPLPLGWPVDARHSLGSLVWASVQRRSTLFGWFFSTVALSMGAPFWFNLLNRAVGLRSPDRRDDPA